MNLHIIQDLLSDDFELWLMGISRRIKLGNYDSKDKAQEGVVEFAESMTVQVKELKGASE